MKDSKTITIINLMPVDITGIYRSNQMTLYEFLKIAEEMTVRTLVDFTKEIKQFYIEKYRELNNKNLTRNEVIELIFGGPDQEERKNMARETMISNMGYKDPISYMFSLSDFELIRFFNKVDKRIDEFGGVNAVYYSRYIKE